MKHGDLVEVEWWDSERVNLGWSSREEYLAAAKDRTLYRTAGYLVGKTRTSIVVSHSRSEGRRTYCDAMIVPLDSVKTVRRLRG